MRKAVPALAMILSASACGGAPQEPSATVENAVVTLPAVPGRPGAAYFTVTTNEDPTRLTGVSSPKVGRIELHETITGNGVTRMAPLGDATFSPHAPLRFEPGGRHAMLFDVDTTVRAGDRLTLTFSFDPVPPVTVEAEVRGPGGAGHSGH